MKIDVDKIRHATKNGIPLVIKTTTLPQATETALERLLMVFLEELGQIEFYDLLAFCLRELISNAKKANMMRAYFQEQGIPLENSEARRIGLTKFRADRIEFEKRYDSGPFFDEQFIKVSFLVRNEVLYLSVRNNAPMTPQEADIVRQLMIRAWGSGTINEYLDQASGDRESRGLGLVTLVLILKKLGMSPQSFEFASSESETTATVRIPTNRVKLKRMNEITEEISSAVSSIPPFPKNLQNLFRLLEDPEVEFRLLASELAQDPAMTADLIKYINSASNRGHKRIDNLEEAIRIVGTRGLKDLMYPYGAHKILGAYLEKQRQLWDNAVQVSRYAVELARENKFDWQEKGQTQIVGLLYNLGQIVLTFLYPELSFQILDFCRRKKLSIDLFDNLTQSINPSVLGGQIAEKWHFPEDLVQILQHQNNPAEAPEALRRAAAAVHLASSLRSVELKLLTYDQVSSETVVLLGLKPEQLMSIHQRLMDITRDVAEQLASN